VKKVYTYSIDEFANDRIVEVIDVNPFNSLDEEKIESSSIA